MGIDARKETLRNISQVMGILARLGEDSAAQVHDLSEAVYYHDLLDARDLIEDCLHNLQQSDGILGELKAAIEEDYA